jgi:hypothetical protein
MRVRSFAKKHFKETDWRELFFGDGDIRAAYIVCG